MKRNNGFTIIELMAVVSIISILSVIALAVYTDYTIRTKVSEGMVFVGEARTGVSSYYYNVGKMPANNGQAGLVEKEEYGEFKFIRTLEIVSTPRPGTISITFDIEGTLADNKTLQLIPNTNGGTVNWTCLPAEDNGIKTNHSPPNCRG